MKDLQRTGIKKLDEMIGGIPRGSRNLLCGKPGTGKTVFAMQFLWQGIEAGETVSYDSIDRPWTHMRRYFQSFGWDIHPHEKEGRFISIQAYPHFAEYPEDPDVRYFSLFDFEEMKAIDLKLSKADVTRFAAGDTLEHAFMAMSEETWQKIEDWTVNWCHHDNITNIDIMNEVDTRDPLTNRMKDFSFWVAHNVIRFRKREAEHGNVIRELRIEKMEGVDHPLEWLRFEIGKEGIQLV